MEPVDDYAMRNTALPRRRQVRRRVTVLVDGKQTRKYRQGFSEGDIAQSENCLEFFQTAARDCRREFRRSV